MIDHVLGRPSVQFRKIQVLAVLSFWSLYLFRGNQNGPPYIRKLSKILTRHLTAWQQLVITLLWLYLARNFGKLVGLECPEPLANLYTRSYFRATWITTALDAGFWSAMRIRSKWLRDFSSVIFSVYYLLAAEQADEKVRKIRATLTVDHLRVSWNKSTTPYLQFLTNLLRPRLARYPPRAIRIPRPPQSSYKDPVNAWLYFDGPLSALKTHTKLIMDVPGGGFVAMTPRNHDDKLLAWAGKTGLPVLSLEYKKAPEFPYPYALNECYDVYHTIMASQGRCIGMSGDSQPSVIITGDSAGGNLATGLVLMVLQSSQESERWQNESALPEPAGLILIYPGLDLNIGNWMTDEQMALIKDRRMRNTNEMILRRKSEDYNKLTPATPHHSDDDEDPMDAATQPATKTEKEKAKSLVSQHPGISTPSLETHKSTLATGKPAAHTVKTRLAVSSMISYFNDRILTPEMMRAMIILYVGPHNRPNFSTEYLLSPLLAPESLLARFPKTHFLTGERDPLVDDTVIFAGRIRQAKWTRWVERKELGLLGPDEAKRFEESDHVSVSLIPGISHGFLQFVSIYPEGWKYIIRCATWAEQIFAKAEEARNEDAEGESIDAAGDSLPDGTWKRHHRRRRTESSGDDDRPLEMSVISNASSAVTAIKGESKASAKDAHASSNRGPRGKRRIGHHGYADDRTSTSWSKSKRSGSSVSLASEDDLLGRRMKGLASGLMGMTGSEEAGAQA